MTFLNSIFLDEINENRYIKNFQKLLSNYNKIYLLGFFQSEKYFKENKESIYKNILKNKINNKKLRQLSKQIEKRDIMIGIRLFEEAPNNLKSKFGGIESKNYYVKNYKKLNKKCIIKKSYIFTTSSNNSLIKNINLKITLLLMQKMDMMHLI